MKEANPNKTVLNIDDVIDKLNLATHIVRQRIKDDDRECIDRLIDAEGNLVEAINALQECKDNPKEVLGDWASLEDWIEHNAPWIQGTDNRVVDARKLVRKVMECKQAPPKNPVIEQVQEAERKRVATVIDNELKARVDKCNRTAKSLSSYAASWAGSKHEAIALASMQDFIREHIMKQETSDTNGNN